VKNVEVLERAHAQSIDYRSFVGYKPNKSLCARKKFTRAFITRM
jgi:hypothetical protein